MRDRVECRLGGEADVVVIERRGVESLSGRLAEPRDPVVDELLPLRIQAGVVAAELHRLLGLLRSRLACRAFTEGESRDGGHRELPARTRPHREGALHVRVGRAIVETSRDIS